MKTCACTDHSDEQPGLLSRSPDTGVTNNSDGKTGGETGETDRETGSELDEPGVQGHGGLQVTRDKDRDDQSVLRCRDYQGQRLVSHPVERPPHD